MTNLPVPVDGGTTAIAPRIPSKEEIHNAFIERIRAIMYGASKTVQRDADMLRSYVRSRL